MTIRAGQHEPPMTHVRPRRAAFYLDGADADAIAPQRAALTAFAVTSGCTLAGEFLDDGTPAANGPMARAGLAALVAAIARGGIDLVLVEHEARLGLDVMQRCLLLHELQQAGVPALTATGDELTALPGTGASKPIREVLAAAADFAALPAIAALRQARPRLSMLDRARAEIRRMRAAGTSLTALARRLNTMGLLDPDGVAWTRMTVLAFSRTLPPADDGAAD